MANQGNIKLSRAILKEQGYNTHAHWLNDGATRIQCTAQTNGKRCRKHSTWSVRDGDYEPSDRYVCDEHLVRAALLAVAPSTEAVADVARCC